MLAHRVTATGALYIVLPRDSQTFMYVVLLYNLFMPTLYLELVNESGGIYVRCTLFVFHLRGFALLSLFFKRVLESMNPGVDLAPRNETLLQNLL